MITLHGRLGIRLDAEPFIARVARGRTDRAPDCDQEVRIVDPGEALVPGYRAYLVAGGHNDDPQPEQPQTWRLPESLHHLADGDIIRISPRTGALWVMYRRGSAYNAMLLTEQCNSYCIMCSQPPKTGDDSHLVRAYLDAIPLMSPDTCELGITGGEPTLLGEGLLEVIRTCKECLPTTLHMLSNGRLFNYLTLCRELGAIDHPDLMVGIPLYSDLPHRHDFVVQAEGAFDQTVRGIMNLARCGISVEIRMVLHRETVDRLPQFARFIARNLPFVDHVALMMGLEMMGFVRMNLDSLWVDPVDYQAELRHAVVHLQQHGLNVSIYNHPLCVLDRQLWPVARKSISDWKNEYLDECQGCVVQDRCGGFFASSSVRRSDHIRRLTSETWSTERPLIPAPSFTL